MEHSDNLEFDIERIKDELTKGFDSKRKRIFLAVLSAALGTVPWVGGYISAMLTFRSDEGQVQTNQLLQQWLEEHASKIAELRQTLQNVLQRLAEFPETIDERLQSPEYLTIVRKAFRIWDTSDTFEKKEIVRKLITNAGGHVLVDDDIIRLFLDWINMYHEAHFAIIKAVYENPGVTRWGMWQQLNGKTVRDDSMEADVFKYIVTQLSIGGVIRQYRPVNHYGEFLSTAKPKRKGTNYTGDRTLTSAFDDEKEYELTELGRNFVHYTMTELVTRLGDEQT